MRIPPITGAAGAVALAAALACGPKAGMTPVDSAMPPPCAVLWPLGAPADTVTVALFDDVDPAHAPLWRNDSERLVFGQLAEPAAATDLDCPCFGEGSYQIDPRETFADGRIILHPAVGAKPVIRFVDARGTDPRDWLEQESPPVDLIVLEDRATIEYAAGLGRYQDVPLSAARGYLLLAATRALAVAGGDSLPPFPETIRGALALEAVRSTFSHALHAVDWEPMVRACDAPVAAAPMVEAPRTRRILYHLADPTARDLADRITALLMGDGAYSRALGEAVPRLPGDDSHYVSVGVASDELARRLHTGADFAYIVSVPLDAARLCAALAALADSAPWIARHSRWPLETVLPLVKTRRVAFAARRAGGFGFDLRPDSGGGVRVCGVPR